jgi:2-haloacid dehalogenase
MSHAPIRGIRACVFDAYGTLFDVAAAARSCSGELGERSGVLSSLWREKQLNIRG